MLDATRYGANITAVIVDPQDTTRVYFATTGDNMHSYISPNTLWLMIDHEDGTEDYIPLRHDGERMRVVKMAITSDHHRLVLATGGNDLHVCDLDSVQITW